LGCDSNRLLAIISFIALTSVLNDKLIYEIEMDVIAVYCEYE